MAPAPATDAELASDRTLGGPTERSGEGVGKLSRIEEVVLEPPRYEGGSIVNLMASMIVADGGESAYPILEGLELDTLRTARNVILIVIDGLGYEHLRSSDAAPVMGRYLERSMTTVFPPTTATAVTTFLTGLAPQQHGLTGWFVHFQELGSVVRVLPFTTRLGSTALESLGVRASEFLGHTPVFDCLTRATFSVSPARIAHSAFNRSHSGDAQIKPYESLEEFFSAIQTIVSAQGRKSFVYAYWSELDHLAHLEGIGSETVTRHLTELDAGFERLLEKIRGTDSLVVLTADHGFIDVAPERLLNLADHPDLSNMLSLPLCGEPRTAYCYVSPGRSADFLSYVEGELDDVAVCVPSEALIEGGYFGPGRPHPRLRDRIGHYTLLMRDGYAIRDTLPGESALPLVGLHGGGTSAELRVPLVLAEA